jgi:nicotinamidase/pyrazinamidase
MTPFALGETALIVVDMQRGFSPLCPDELPMAGSLELIPRINQLLELNWRQIHASQDWHPANHRSFLGNRDNHYPPHCVQGTPGCEFLPGLHTHRFHAIWRKGFDSEFEAYAVTAQHPEFGALLVLGGIKRVFICGLATNICCYSTARDLRHEHLNVAIIEDASAGIDIPSANLFQEQAKEEGLKIGISYVTSAQVFAGAQA